MKQITKTELNLILKDHKKWLKDPTTGKQAHLSEANLEGANLYRADLEGAHLEGANLAKANLEGTLYENDFPVIINTEYYNIFKTKAFIKIGCKKYTPEEWEQFSDEEIDLMDRYALQFWKKYKNLILS